MEIIDQVRQAANIVEIASQYTALKARGRKHVGLCPFHSEKTLSFDVFLQDPGICCAQHIRGFCPSCHAKRIEEWGGWMRETLLLDVPHRQVVFTIPKCCGSSSSSSARLSETPAFSASAISRRLRASPFTIRRVAAL